MLKYAAEPILNLKSMFEICFVNKSEETKFFLILKNSFSKDKDKVVLVG